MSKKIGGILFDKDGTLLDFHRSWMPAIRAAAAFASRGDEVLAAHLLEVGGFDRGRGRVRAGSPLAAGTAAEIAALWAMALPGRDPAALTEEIDAIFVEGGRCHATPVTDLAALFSRLKAKGFALGVATSDSHRGALASLEPFGVTDLLDFVAGYDSGYGSKPGPGMFEAFCEATGHAPADVVMVGDNRHDLEMGRAGGAGLIVGVLTGTGEAKDLATLADRVLDSISDLEALLPA